MGRFHLELIYLYFNLPLFLDGTTVENKGQLTLLLRLDSMVKRYCVSSRYDLRVQTQVRSIDFLKTNYEYTSFREHPAVRFSDSLKNLKPKKLSLSAQLPILT